MVFKKVDATSLPNEITSSFSNWGRADGSIEKQFRLLCVLDQRTKMPVFYRYLPGNITDVITLKTTILELSKMGVESSFELLDAGYFSESNIVSLYEQEIDFMTRLPASRRIYKDLIGKKNFNLEKTANVVKCGARGLFIKRKKINIYGKTAYAYIILDPTRKGKEICKLILDYFDQKNQESIDTIDFNNCGIMILVSSKKLTPQEALNCYYTRQSVEQVFGYYKEDIGSWPIRRHNEDTIRGYLFLQFLSLIFFITLNGFGKTPPKICHEKNKNLLNSKLYLIFIILSFLYQRYIFIFQIRIQSSF